MITTGEHMPIVYEMRISASELDVILIALDAWETTDTLFKKQRDELRQQYRKLQNIRGVDGLVKYGVMDKSRMNWK